MTFSLTWLASTLRSGGCAVNEIAGWQSRGRGEMGAVKGVLAHHTAGPKTGNAPSLNLIINGRPDLPGPLSQLHLARDGTYNVIAAGRCNHAGAGAWQGVTTGNTSMIGIEAENMGTPADPWPAHQVEAYARGVAAILKHIGAAAIMCAGHKEYALPLGRKIDPSFDMPAFRQKVTAFMGGQPVAPAASAQPVLKRGATGQAVILLQTRLHIAADGNFGPATETAVKAFQSAHGLAADGVVGPATWRALGA